ncbi:MAG: SLC13/DASS family transporter [Deltaproteobacteria bacterium]|nr:SLC13/DASS family transporter [Deltaproteobacteria bacterium]
MEPKEVLSRAEEAVERWRRGIGLFLGPVVFLILYFIPVPSLSAEAKDLLAVTGFVLVYWLSEAIPLPATALAGAVLNVFLGVAPAVEVIGPFAHPLIFLFIGSFILAEAVTLHGLERRFSFAILSIRFLEESPLRILFAFGLIAASISMWISNTAATAMMLPVALGMLNTLKDARGNPPEGGFGRSAQYPAAMMLMVAYGASIGGIATPIGTPPNLIGIGMIEELTGLKISFFEWMMFAVPLTVIMFIYLFLILGRFNPGMKMEITGVRGYVERARLDMGRWTRGEINTAACFFTAVSLWVLPSVAELFLGKGHHASMFLSSRLDEGVVAIFAALLLFILPVSLKDRVFTMTWERAAKIDWGTILLFGGGLSLGKLMFSTGLAAAMGNSLVSLTGAGSLWGITAIGILFAMLLSETTSNTTSASMVIPVVIAIAKGAGVPAVVPALGACLGASFGFMLPVSTPPNAIVYGSGLVPILTMAKKGIILDIGGFFIILLGLMVLAPLFGWV